MFIIVLVIALSLLNVILFIRNTKQKTSETEQLKIENSDLIANNKQLRLRVTELEKEIYSLKGYAIKEFSLLDFLKTNEHPLTPKTKPIYSMKEVAYFKARSNKEKKKVGEKFEYFLINLFQMSGYKIRKVSVKDKSDGGRDIEIDLNDIGIWIEAKVRHFENTTKIGVKDIRNLYAVVAAHNINNAKKVKGVLVTTGFSTIQARKWALDHGIEIIDRKGLFRLVEYLNSDVLASYTWLEDRDANFLICESCNGVRVKTHDGRRGKFDGCINFNKEGNKECTSTSEDLRVYWN